MIEVAVLGAGGVGGLVAAALARAGADPLLIAREPTAELIAARGVAVRSAVFGDFVAHPQVASVLTEPVAVLVVATKAWELADALERIATDPDLVVPLLNGLDHLALLRARFGGERVCAGVIRVESDRPAPGEIVQTSPACRIDLASARPRVQRAADLLRGAGIEVRTGASEAQVMWSKLARLAPLALTTSAYDESIGEVRDDPQRREALELAVAETVAVANAAGAGLNGADTLAELFGAPAGLGSSMRRDLAAGRAPELDAIAGAVLRAGARFGVACPTVALLADRVAARAGLPCR
ncbi:MAG: ketopantoate reductase family protein [Solirubrobacteraceae bacterium]